MNRLRWLWRTATGHLRRMNPAQRRAAAEHRALAHRHRRWVILNVRLTGDGLTDDERQELLEEFRRGVGSKPTGSGNR